MTELHELLQCPNCHSRNLYRERLNAQNYLVCGNCAGRTTISDNGVIHFSIKDSAGFSIRWEHNQTPQATNEWFKTFLEKPDVEGKVVLDAGCGIGRYSRNALDLGAGRVVSVDLSPWAIKGTLRNAPGADVLQADLLCLPVRDQVIDVAFSIGVLHHTPDPRAAFMEVARTVKRGGLFSCWVYENFEKDPAAQAAKELLHAITKACPPKALHAAIAEHAVKVRDLYNQRWDPLMRVLRVSCSQDDAECISDTLDWHAPTWRFEHTIEEVLSWYNDAGFDVLRHGIKEFRTAVLGRKH